MYLCTGKKNLILKKRVLIITYYWPPSGGAGVQRWLKFSKYLLQLDWDPIILTVDENYASYPQKDESLIKEAQIFTTFKTKTFELYSLYSSFKKDKQIPYGGFSNEGNPTFIQKTARFVRGNFFLPDPRRGWNKHAIKEAIRIISEYKIEHIITTSPPHSSQLIGIEIKKKIPNVNWVADMRDPWTDIYFYDKFYPSFWARKIDRKYEKSIIDKADKIITVSKSIKKMLNKRYGKADKIIVIPNAYDPDDFPQDHFHDHNRSNTIVYTGTLTTDYPLEEILTIAKNNPTLHLKFIGSTPPELILGVEREHLSKQFTIQEAVSHDEIIQEMLKAGILLLLIPKVPQNDGILTGKLFEYLGSKTPILAIGPANGDIIEILEETKAGIYYTYQDVESINARHIQQIQKIKSNPKTQNYSRKNLTQKIVNLLENK